MLAPKINNQRKSMMAQNIWNEESYLRPEVKSPSRILSDSPDGKLSGIEPFRASWRWKAPMDDMTTIFTSWSLTNSCSHSLKQAKSLQHSAVQGNRYGAVPGLQKICIAIMVEDASRLIQELCKAARNWLLPRAAPRTTIWCLANNSASQKRPALSKEGSNI